MQLNGHPSYSFVFMLLVLVLVPAMMGDWQPASIVAVGALYPIFGVFCSLVAGTDHRMYYMHKPLFYIPLWPTVPIIGLFRFLQIVWRVNRVRR